MKIPTIIISIMSIIAGAITAPAATAGLATILFFMSMFIISETSIAMHITLVSHFKGRH